VLGAFSAALALHLAAGTALFGLARTPAAAGAAQRGGHAHDTARAGMHTTGAIAISWLRAPTRDRSPATAAPAAIATAHTRDALVAVDARSASNAAAALDTARTRLAAVPVDATPLAGTAGPAPDTARTADTPPASDRPAVAPAAAATEEAIAQAELPAVATGSATHAARSSGAAAHAAAGAGGRDASRTAPGASVGAGGDDRAFADFLAAVSERIGRHLVAPARAARGGQVLLGVVLDRGGRLRKARVERSSGDRALDRAAQRALRRAAPFPVPPGLPETRLRFEVPIAFVFE